MAINMNEDKIKYVCECNLSGCLLEESFISPDDEKDYILLDEKRISNWREDLLPLIIKNSHVTNNDTVLFVQGNLSLVEDFYD